MVCTLPLGGSVSASAVFPLIEAKITLKTEARATAGMRDPTTINTEISDTAVRTSWAERYFIPDEAPRLFWNSLFFPKISLF
jgi:hypothetical protein